MRRSGIDTQTGLWAVLVVATVVTLLLGDTPASAGSVAGAVALAIAAIKMRLVGIHFMELDNAPTALRGLFETYVGVTFVALLVLYEVV